ncbi:response regulator [Cellulophaga sp. HaHa_2_95]|uniref:response regulator n=1 Tax=unclassified Cellulophaga TaxID=2634405 RepID=UPI001C4F9109|nr:MULTISPECIES: response regulator [unclassified Cellulophaga]QXP50947.1 response regulator [Cellulophaga sp. HaHa_2_1]QXP56725.1 response regulator [Cellulophaga sp. HaHa_2_95]
MEARPAKNHKFTKTSSLVEYMKVWIIDDDLVSRFATQYGVQQASALCSIAIFESAGEVLDLIRKDSFTGDDLPDILLLDLVMPEINGWQFLEELEVTGKTKDTLRIYVLSAFTNYKDRILAKDHPLVYGYFDKPLSRVSADAIFKALE